MRISIIIPAYNEETTISKILDKVMVVKLGTMISKEIIVVNDCSTDKTAQILRKISGIKVYHHNKNLGKGAAVVTGISKSTGEIVIIQDADLEYDPRDYPKLIDPILHKKIKVVYGSRLRNYPLHLFGRKKTPLITHYLGNKLLTLATNILFGNGVTDMETGYKVFRKNVLNGIRLYSKRFEFEAEFTAKILKRGIKIYEVPIKVQPRGYNEGKKITWRDGFVALWTLIKYRFVD